MGGGFQYLDLIFFGIVAVFLVLRLRSVLGRRTGSERQRPDPFAGAPAKDQPAAARAPNGALPDISAKPAIGSPAATSPVAAGLARIRSADPSFDESQFLTGARGAFELIVNDYAAGDSATLRPLLSDEVFANFSRAIEERQKNGHTLSTTLVGIRAAEIIEADLQGRNAVITVKMVSDQINVTRDGDGKVVEGDPSAVTSVTDIWTFSRNTRARDPNWTLVATRSPN
jgi:predicted lipid-binding transport protein (Tim44 family)